VGAVVGAVVSAEGAGETLATVLLPQPASKEIIRIRQSKLYNFFIGKPPLKNQRLRGAFD
jgi:hypothetical protein